MHTHNACIRFCSRRNIQEYIYYNISSNEEKNVHKLISVSRDCVINQSAFQQPASANSVSLTHTDQLIGHVNIKQLIILQRTIRCNALGAVIHNKFICLWVQFDFRGLINAIRAFCLTLASARRCVASCSSVGWRIERSGTLESFSCRCACVRPSFRML